jgi:branched-chain amino acid transport system substrate-binding protein
MNRITRSAAALAAAAAAGLLHAGTAAAQSCPVKVGGVLPLTGSMAPITKKIAQAAELAFDHINQGGGIKGCPVQFILRDDQGQPTVGVDAAKYLV